MVHSAVSDETCTRSGAAGVPVSTDGAVVSRGGEEDKTITVLDLSDPNVLAMMEVSKLAGQQEPTSSIDTVSIIELASTNTANPDGLNKCGALNPDVKKELQSRIRAKLLQNGEDPPVQLTLTTPKKVRTEELTPEEQERRRIRRERNKLAAQKCRGKRQERVEQLEQESESLQTQNETLKEQIEKLLAEKEMLINMVKTHDRCPRTCNTQLSSSSDGDVSEITEQYPPDIGLQYLIESSELSGIPLIEDGVLDVTVLSE